MKKIFLKSIALVNFKGEKERTTEFNPDVTTISGANGLGKSRHFDAFMWLLFGKDSQDRKDYEIKTRINGEELHGIECSVAGVINVDGEDIALKRSFVEDWVKPRGQAERVFKGNHTECWWNDVPVNVTEYTKRINALVSDTVFKMVTNPAFFANMDWKLQRQQLFLLAGTVSDSEIAAGNADFAELLDAISGKSMSDYKAELAAKKSRLKAELEQIRPRIDQTHKMMPDAPDFVALERRKSEIDAETAQLDQMISDASKALRARYEEEQERAARINELILQQQQILFDARRAEKDAVNVSNAEYHELESHIEELERVRTQSDVKLEAIDEECGRIQALMERDVERQDVLRDGWHKENAKEYSGETECPYCHQPLPQSMIDEAKSIFIRRKTEKLNEITYEGQAISKHLDELKNRLAEMQKSKAPLKNDFEKTVRLLLDAKKRLEEMPIAKEKGVMDEDLPAWVALQNQIDEIKASITTDSTFDDSTSEMQSKKRSLVAERDNVVKQIAVRDTIARAVEEIDSLEKRGRTLAQQIADIEKSELTMQKFIQAKIDECTSRINGMFHLVKFNLYNRTIDGNIVETCVPMVNGVPYPAANTAGRINAGIDIINTLCRYYGVSAPIVIDNRESVNNLIETDSQIINLVVTNEPTLTVK